MMTEVIKLVLAKRRKNRAWLAEQLHYTPANIYTKMKKDNFSESELRAIAKVLDCTFEASFVLNDTKERLSATKEDFDT